MVRQYLIKTVITGARFHIAPLQQSNKERCIEKNNPHRIEGIS